MYDNDNEWIQEPHELEELEPRRPARRQWRTKSEREDQASREPVTFAGGATAAQIIRIQAAWDAVVSPMSSSSSSAVRELLAAAHDAGWTTARLAEWTDGKVSAVSSARDVVLGELRARLASSKVRAA